MKIKSIIIALTLALTSLVAVAITPVEALNDYYATGIDVYRMATNEGVGDKLSPPKTYIRSETVDFQPGEVEWRKGNLFYDKWDSHLKVNSITKISD